MGPCRGTAIVTGAGSGIGHATTIQLLSSGFDVAMAGLEPAPQAGLPSVDGRSVRYYRFDLADIDGHASLLDAVERDLGAIACLVNNAGVTSLARGDLLELTPESFDRSVAVNLRGTFFLTQAVAKRMLAGPQEDVRLRSLITVSSANADIVGENRGDYCMSKAGLAMMNKLFASRLAAAGIAAFEIRPGIIETAMTAPATARYSDFIAEGGVPMRRWGQADEVAQAIATLARGELPFATGIHLDIGGGLQLHRV